MPNQSDAPALLAKMEREGFPPMDPREFQQAYELMIKVAAGMLPRPVLTEMMIDPATGEATGPSTPAEWGMAAAAQMLNEEDPLKPPNFTYRVNKICRIAREKEYLKYQDANGTAMHVALLAAIAQVRFSTRTTPKALRAAFAVEFKLQRARLADEMVSLIGSPSQASTAPRQPYALKPLPGVVAGSYVPLTLAEFRKAYTRMLRVTGGLEEAPPVRGDEIVQVDSDKRVELEDNLFNRGWIAGARTLGDNADSPKPTSFVARVIRVLPIAQGPEYEEYRTDSITLHIVLIAALAAVPFNGKTSEAVLREAFAAEVTRQFGRMDELMAEAMAEPDFHQQDFASTKH